MISSRELLSMPVYTPSRRLLGQVADVAFEPRDGILRGLLIEKNGWLARKAFIPADCLLKLERSGVLARDVDYGRATAGLCLLSAAPWRHRVWPPSGDTIAELLLDRQRIVGAELSAGLLADLRYGRNFIDWQDLQVGGDVWRVPDLQ